MAKAVSSVSCIINHTVVRGSRAITRVILFLTNPSGVESYHGGISRAPHQLKEIRVQELCESRARWPSWAFRPNEFYGFCGRKATLNHASALVTVCP